MANVKNGRRKLLKTIITVIIVIVLSFLGVNIYEYIPNDSTISEELTEIQEGNLELTMINVGQADSFLLVQDNHAALVDCGTRSNGKDVVAFLKSKGISKLDYVIGTHPHDDHMGGMYDVLTNFEVEKIIIPNVTKNKITTVWYTKLMNEIMTNNYTVIYPEVNEVYLLGDATLNIVGPFEEPENNLNNYSIVIKVSFGEIDILMTGDMEKDVESELISSGADIDVEILKVGHHGSDTSSCEEFLDATTPQYALISSKIGNKYNHPVKTTMDNLEKRCIEVYRTDECGTVTLNITGNTIDFNTLPGDYLSGPELEEKVE